MALQGLSWVLIGSFDPMGLYDGFWARELFSTAELPPDAAAARDFLMILFGATDAAYFVLFAMVLGNGWRTRQAWTTRALMVSFLTWFGLDTVFCLLRGAAFNVVIVNVPAFMLVMPFLWRVHRCLASESASG